ncbi:8-amino-7-oxononanoate synthase [Sphingopyxis sp. 113P3]|uniref:8-amino-7-oxononanoate synthase n=1 Tax=Sphingopyxis sp. (strain 113P3) TaxID=292913 RepID=UPI0006BCB7FF|nr:8-amino-7-oxononanoate synthase [Sphingopyxis sp. 113P3]ALC11871.1 8-amino-7-oxononanoate synthase [Sphingopyxis sp. 113P3]
MSSSNFPFRAHRANLAALAAEDRRRSLNPRKGVDFASNDYLALAGSYALSEAIAAGLERGIPAGSGGSRLLRGNHAEHEALEAHAARHYGSEAALFFSTGFAANAALFATLPQRGDLVVHDELIHASAHDGMKLGRAGRVDARHNDAQAFDDIIGRWRRGGGTGTPWIAVESLYSMDGDRAPLGDLAAVAERHDAVLVIDEAHATGVYGPAGQGLAHELADRENIITLHTCGKALGCEGALLCGPAIVRDFVVNRGRPFIFSTAPSPLVAWLVRHALEIVANEPERAARLHALVRRAETRLAPLGIAASGSQIIPILIGDNGRTMQIAAALQDAGFDVRGIRPPTVPHGTARLRIAITLNVDEPEIDAMVDALAAAMTAA